MDDLSTRLSRSLSAGSFFAKVRRQEETDGFSTRLSRCLPDLGKTFLEKNITFLEEFKRSASTEYYPDGLYDGLYDHDAREDEFDPYDGLYDDDAREDEYDPYDGLYDDDARDDEYDPYDGLYDDDARDDEYDPYDGLYDDDARDDEYDPYDGLYDDDARDDEYDPYDGLYDDEDNDEVASSPDRSAKKRKKASSPDLPHVPCKLETMLQDQSSRPHDIPLQDLRQITDNFSEERILGQGGFGVVYKGVLRNGEIIAVKKIVSSLMPGLQKQFESEVYHLMMLKHPNIVRCLGYCYEIQNTCLEYNGKYVFAETAERLLCLEYLPKGSLDKYISDESSGLDWSARYTIIEGICYGLRHLHEQIDKPIIHLDLKPSNILLDDNLVPKITDFGLSRLVGQPQSTCTSSRIGTFGYMAPEFLHGGTITPKLDIFCFGVITMEIITGHRDYPGVTGTTSDDFIELALEKWRNVLQRSPGYGSLEKDCEQIKRCIQVGLICVNPDRTKRPPMAKIINMLQGSENIDYDISNEAAQLSG